MLNQENNDIVKGIEKDTVNLIKKYPSSLKKIILDELLQKFKKSRRAIVHLIK